MQIQEEGVQREVAGGERGSMRWWHLGWFQGHKTFSKGQPLNLAIQDKFLEFSLCA